MSYHQYDTGIHVRRALTVTGLTTLGRTMCLCYNVRTKRIDGYTNGSDRLQYIRPFSLIVDVIIQAKTCMLDCTKGSLICCAKLNYLSYLHDVAMATVA